MAGGKKKSCHLLTMTVPVLGRNGERKTLRTCFVLWGEKKKKTLIRVKKRGPAPVQGGKDGRFSDENETCDSKESSSGKKKCTKLGWRIPTQGGGGKSREVRGGTYMV